MDQMRPLPLQNSNEYIQFPPIIVMFYIDYEEETSVLAQCILIGAKGSKIMFKKRIDE